MLGAYGYFVCGSAGAAVLVAGGAVALAAGIVAVLVAAGGGAVLVATGTGAALPAVCEPRPSFSSDKASIFPVGLSPFLSWYFLIASAVASSHFPVGAPS